jgi:hypothetical protein
MFVFPFEDINRLRRGQYVLVVKTNTDNPYLGVLFQVLFITPDAVSKDSAFARTSICNGE